MNLTPFFEMNIPSVLYDHMARVPAEQIKVLDSAELELYGLKQDDPVFAELRRQAETRAARLPMTEYLPRKAAYDRCVTSLFQRRHEEGKVGMTLEDLKEIGKGKDECLNRFILRDSQR